MNRIILVIGPPASGKTTIAHAVAARLPKSLHIRVDQLREMMVSGVQLPGEAWSDETTHQFRLARRTAIYMAQLYTGQGVDVLIDDVCVPPEFPEHYAGLLPDPSVRRILLLPNATVLTERLKQRGGPYDRILLDVVPWFYSYLEPMPKEGWVVLDSSDWTVEQTVSAVLERI